jgi:hypothetical protein
MNSFLVFPSRLAMRIETDSLQTMTQTETDNTLVLHIPYSGVALRNISQQRGDVN